LDIGAKNQYPEVMVTFDDISVAARCISGIAHRTPVVTSRLLNEVCGNQMFLKCENLQRIGAFKFRGAYHAINRLPKADQSRGVISYSSGNHAQAVALVCRILGISAVIVMPDTASAAKMAAVRAYGAEIVLHDPRTTSREVVARSMAAERGFTVIPPFDHPDIIAGQGTAALELFEEAGDLDYLFVPCGGGGLISGSAIAARRLAPRCRVVGVEPAAGDDATRSFHTGTLQSVHNPDTIADGARTSALGKLTFPLIRQNVDDMMTVSDDDLVHTMFFVWSRLKLIVEPTGVLGLAALFQHRYAVGGKRIGVIISGGNVDIASAARWFGDLKLCVG
jgi:threo-3-hydroxy-L-aspartate ammonia-lyase